jgi:hypothetical protein
MADFIDFTFSRDDWNGYDWRAASETRRGVILAHLGDGIRVVNFKLHPDDDDDLADELVKAEENIHVVDEEGSSFLSFKVVGGKVADRCKHSLEESVLTDLFGKMISLIRNQGWRFKPDHIGEYGFVVDIRGDWHKLDCLPDGLHVAGDLRIVRRCIERLPDNLRVDGSLNLYGTPIKALPANLHVGGDVMLTRTMISELPDGFTVRDHLSVAETPMRRLPSNLKVPGWLRIDQTEIEEIPSDARLGGPISAGRSGLKVIPENMTVKGRLDLECSKITALPNGLRVKGNLNIAQTEITELPADLVVTGELNVSDTKIVKIPHSVRATDVRAYYSHLKTLPPRMKVRNLELVGSQIEEIPPGIVIGGSLKLAKTKVERLPDNLTVPGYLGISMTDINSLPQSLAVGETLELNDRIASLPADLVVRGSLVLNEHIKKSERKRLLKRSTRRQWLVSRIKNSAARIMGRNVA